jgi:hypothetical protein
LKQWSAEDWRELANGLLASGIEPVWSAGRGEEELVRASDPAGVFRSFAGRLDLAQVWQLLAGSDLLICPDTGIAHLGRIAGVPTVTLFGPGSPILCGAGQFWRESPYRAVWVDPFACRDQHLLFKREVSWVRRCARTSTQCAAPRCLEAVSLTAVRGAITELGISLSS